MPPLPGNNSAATNAKPRDTIAGLWGSPPSVASFRRVAATCAGHLVPASGRAVSIVIDSISSMAGFNDALHIPAGIQVDTPRAMCSRLANYSGRSIRDAPQTCIEGGHRWSASGSPARRGAHNGRTSMQQPDHHWLVWEPVPNRTSEALSVDSCCATASSHSAKNFAAR